MAFDFKLIGSVAVILILLVAIRWPSLSHRGIDHDESISMLVSSGQSRPEFPTEVENLNQTYERLFKRNISFSQIANDLKEKDVHPPFYFWTLSAWKSIAGPSLEAQRWFSVVVSLLMSLSLFQLVRLWGYAREAFLVLILSSVISGVMFFSVEVRPYAFTSFLLSFAALIAELSIRKNHWPWFALLGFVLGIGVFTNYIMAFAALGVGIWLVLRQLYKRNWRTSIVNTVSYGLPLLGFGLLTLPFFFAQRGSRPNQDAGYNGVLPDFAHYISDSSRILIAVRSNSIIYFILTGLIILAFSACFFLVIKKNSLSRPAGLALTMYFSPFLGLMFLNWFLHKEVYRIRYLSFFAPGLVLVVAIGLIYLGRRHIRLSVTCFAFLILLALTNMNWGQAKAPTDFFGGRFREMAQKIVGASAARNLVIIERGDSRDMGSAMTYELVHAGAKNFDLVFLPIDQDPSSLRDQIGQYNRYWYIFGNYDREERKRQLTHLLARQANVVWQHSDPWYFQSAPVGSQ